MKKKFLIFLSAMLMLSSMTGCSGTGKVNNETTSQNQQTTTVAESSQQETKQEMTAAQTETSEPTVVRMSLGSEPDSLDPWQSAASDTEAIFHNVFEGLLVYDSTGALVPGIAESYEISDDGDVILLSPASASWDQYKECEVRGTEFKDLVLKLKESKI